MQRTMVLLVVVAGLSACSDDDRNKTTPDTAFVDVPAAVSNQGHVRILFEALGNANNFICKLDDGAPSQCVSPFEADVGDGDHVFEVAAALNANVDETPAHHTWRIDSLSPDTMITSAPPPLDNSLVPMFAFAGNDGSSVRAAVTFECALDGAAFAPCVSPLTLNVIDGIHSFAVRAKDEAGNVDPSPATHGWTIDATAPETAIISGPAAASTSGPSGSFEFSSPDATATFECAFDAGAFAACTSPRPFALGDGAHTFQVRAKDPGGIVDPSPATRAWNVDAVAPTVMITATPTNPSNQTTPMFAFSSPDATATFECQVDGVTTFAACSSPFTSPALADGSRTFRVRAKDPFNNVGAPATHTWVVDLIAPVVTLQSQPAALSNDNTPTITFTITGAPITVECRLDGGTLMACNNTFTIAAADGTHTITVVATDQAGNPGSATTSMFVVDTVIPTVTIATQPAALSNDTTPTVTFTTTDNPTIIQCQVDAGSFAACTSGFTPTVTEGTHTITVRVADDATNSSTATTAMFVVDVTPPAVTITGSPAALSNNNDPQVIFTTGGAPATIQCRLDTGAFGTCTSPFTFTNVLDGTHTITVRVVDAAGNPATATTGSFVVDTVGPAMAFIDQPPAAWPVDYFDFLFSVGDATSVTCSLDGAAPTACTSGITVTAAYNVNHAFTVVGTDAAGNPTQITATWTPTDGLVLHYPWEQGRANNTSLLSQRSGYAANGPAASQPFVGGWAGTALGNSINAHGYTRTNRPLSSSATGNYTVSFWIRPTPGVSGTIFSTMNGGTNGTTVAISSPAGAPTALTITAAEGGQSQQGTTFVTANRWVHVGLRTTGPAKGLEVFIDGNSRVTVPTFSGFVPSQLQNMIVGPWSLADVDDLRFYNKSFSAAEHCTVLARGFVNGQNQCVPMAPGFELDMELGAVKHTGLWPMSLALPQTAAFGTDVFGGIMHLASTFGWGYTSGFASQVQAAPGHSMTFEFVAGGVFGNLVDFRIACNAATGGGGLCGMLVSWTASGLAVYTGTATDQKTTTVAVPAGLANVTITEKRNAQGTASISIYVNGALSAFVPIASGDIFVRTSDGVAFPSVANLFVDEFEFWAADLSGGAELLCENGFDGEFDVVDGTCSLPYGP